MTFQRFRNSLR